MKKILCFSLAVIGFIAIMLSSSLKAAETKSVPVGEDLTKATVVTKVDLPALLSRKTYRLGVRIGMLSASDSVTVTKDTPFSFGLDFDAKLNENLDTGPRFSYVSKNMHLATTTSTYGVLMFGYGARLYMMYWGDYGSTHGFVNSYIVGEVNYCTANKSSDVIGIGPSSYAGFLANGGAGIELAFGPNTTVFADVRYQRSKITDSTGAKLPLDGFILNLGTRLAFI